VIGNVGTAIGAANINIARMHWSRVKAKQRAMVVFSTDTPLDEEILKKMKETTNVISVYQLEM